MTCRKGPGMVVVFISAFIEHWKDSCANFFFDMAILRNFPHRMAWPDFYGKNVVNFFFSFMVP